MGLFKCLNFQSFPLYLSKRKASVHFHEQMPCLKAVFLQPLLFVAEGKLVFLRLKYMFLEDLLIFYSVIYDKKRQNVTKAMK